MKRKLHATHSSKFARVSGFEIFKTNNSFRNCIPVHIDNGTAFHEAKKYLRDSNCKDKKILVAFDYPGVGKTTTIHNAALDSGWVHVMVIVPASAIDQCFIPTLDNLFRKQKIIYEVEALEQIRKTFLATVLACLSDVESHTLDKSERQFYKCFGFSFSDCYEEVLRSPTEALHRQVSMTKSILDKTERAGILFHLDECQRFYPQKTFERRNEYVDHSTVRDLYFIGVCQLLGQLISNTFKVAMSGTSILLERRIQIDAGVSLCKIYLPYTTTEVIVRCLERYYQFPAITTEQLHEELAALCGPFRLVQYFLMALETQHSIPASKYKVLHLRDAIRMAYILFCDYVDDIVTLAGINLNEIVTATKHSNLLDGVEGTYFPSQERFERCSCDIQSQDISKIKVVKYREEDVNGKWLNSEDQAAIRWLRSAGSYYIVEPFPFLEKYYASKLRSEKPSAYSIIVKLKYKSGKS